MPMTAGAGRLLALAPWRARWATLIRLDIAAMSMILRRNCTISKLVTMMRRSVDVLVRTYIFLQD